MSDLHVIGAGGIGSYFLEIVSDLIQKQQMNSIRHVLVYDPDEVDMKNTFYQNFKIDEIGLLKTDAIKLRYQFLSKPIKVEKFDKLFTAEDNIVVSCVDNWQTRAELFKAHNALDPKIIKNNRWIDLRSHGNQIACYINSPNNTLEKMLATLPKSNAPVEEGANSCQNPYDLFIGKIQLGNRIIANIGAQMLLNLTRGTLMGDKFELFI